MDKNNSQDKASIAMTLTKEQEKTILDQANNSLCLITYNHQEEEGFFCLIPDSDFASLQPVLITVYLSLNEKKTLKLVYKNQEKIIDIDESRHVYLNKSYNITIIELKQNEFPQEIFLILDGLINNNGKEEVLNSKYINQDIYLIHHNKENNPEYSYDKIKEIRSFLINDYCPNEDIFEGSPILNLSNFNVIGIHRGKSQKTNVNIGCIIRVPINEYNKTKEGSKKQNENIGLLNIVKKTDEPKSIIELISQNYSKDKDYLLKKLSEYLILAELTDDYKIEVEKKFQTNITKVFDTKTDTNTLLNVLSKVKGLPNLIVTYAGEGKDEDSYINHLFYVNGKIDIVDNTFTFENSDIFGYGNYEPNNDEEYEFVSFRPQNTQLYIKIKIDCIYVMCYREGVEVKFILKIKQNFMENPFVSLYGKEIDLEKVEGIGDAAGEDEGDDEISDFEKIMKHKENIDEIFEKQTKLKNYNIKELVIYKNDD